MKHDAYSKTYPQKAYATANNAFMLYDSELYLLLIKAYIVTDMTNVFITVSTDINSSI